PDPHQRLREERRLRCQVVVAQGRTVGGTDGGHRTKMIVAIAVRRVEHRARELGPAHAEPERVRQWRIVYTDGTAPAEQEEPGLPDAGGKEDGGGSSVGAAGGEVD